MMSTAVWSRSMVLRSAMRLLLPARRPRDALTVLHLPLGPTTRGARPAAGLGGTSPPCHAAGGTLARGYANGRRQHKGEVGPPGRVRCPGAGAHTTRWPLSATRHPEAPSPP